jgi:hypothetical protein
MRRIVPSLELVGKRTQKFIATAGIGPTSELTWEERCISPSDFGFHNALRQPGPCIAFYDFEHAGWDDPAKLVADFFCQVERPVPDAYMQTFQEQYFASFPNSRQLAYRFAALLPSYRVKWCCILLNEFLPDAQGRRQFSGAQEPNAVEAQCAKVTRTLQKLGADLRRMDDPSEGMGPRARPG